jgi:catechol 2,3-dioxygenase-like lactoylglutathione lyase family enzyme
MKLNHLNLVVPDVPRTAKFFEEFFGFRPTEQKGRDALAVLFDTAGFALVLSNFERATAVAYPRDFHIGFLLESETQVKDVFERLKAAGHVEKPPQRMHGSWSFYVTAPGGINVEVSYPVEA